MRKIKAPNRAIKILEEMKKIIDKGIKDLCLDNVQDSFLSFIGRWNDHNNRLEIFFTATEIRFLLLRLSCYLDYKGYESYKKSDCSYFKNQYESLNKWISPFTPFGETDLSNYRTVWWEF